MNISQGAREDKIRYGPRGKYFTEVISKEPIPVLISTQMGQIEGLIYVHPEHRLLDEINEGPPFLAVTEARIDENGEVVETQFLALNREQINWVIPSDEIRGSERNGD